MTSSNGSILRVTGHLCGGNSPVNSTHKDQWREALMSSLICTWINVWVNNAEAGDLRRHCAHYDVTVMLSSVTTDGCGQLTIVVSCLRLSKVAVIVQWLCFSYSLLCFYVVDINACTGYYGMFGINNICDGCRHRYMSLCAANCHGLWAKRHHVR